MQDFYIHAATKVDLLELLAPLGLVFEGDFIQATHQHALVYLGPVIEIPAVYDEEGEETTPATYLPGVYLFLSCLTPALADAVLAAGLDIVEKPGEARTWA